jgi:ABC-2 type transport system permease protein
MFGNMSNVQSHFVFMRFYGALDYYATLPIRKHNLILAVVLSFLLLSAPSLILTMLIGAYILRLPIGFHPLLLVIIPASAVSLSAIGALIGTGVRTRHQAGAISLIVTMVMAGLGPVVVPPERLPRVLIWLGWVNPATYAASALRQTVIGPITGRLTWDLVVLLGSTLLIFAVVSRVLDWRQN